MAQDGFPARGQDVLLRLKVDGVLHRYPFTSVDIDWGLDIATSEYVGDTTQRPYGVNRAARLRLEAEPNSDVFSKLVAAQRKANGPNATRSDVQIDVTLRTDHGPGGRPSWAFNGCTFGNPTQRSGGPAEKVRNSFELVCPEPTPI